MSVPPPPGLPPLAEPPGCCCSCATIRDAGTGAAFWISQQPQQFTCAPGPLVTNQFFSSALDADCTQPKDITVGSCGGPFGCRAGFTIANGSTYSLIRRFSNTSIAGVLMYVCMRPDLTVDLFGIMPNYSASGNPAFNCIRANMNDCSDVWSAFDVPYSLAPITCRMSIPEVPLTIQQQCNGNRLVSLAFRLDP